MTGRAKIEGLTNSWYGFAVFSAVTSLVADLGGLGIWKIGTTVAWLLLSWAVMFFIGRRLLAKSSLTRALLIAISGIVAVFGTLSVGRTTWNFVTTWELHLLGAATYTAVSTWMNIKSFRTLRDESVKAYFG